MDFKTSSCSNCCLYTYMCMKKLENLLRVNIHDKYKKCGSNLLLVLLSNFIFFTFAWISRKLHLTCLIFSYFKAHLTFKIVFESINITSIYFSEQRQQNVEHIHLFKIKQKIFLCVKWKGFTVCWKSL